MAQLGARFHGMEEVEGSSPSRSTNFFNKLERLDRIVIAEIPHYARISCGFAMNRNPAIRLRSRASR